MSSLLLEDSPCGFPHELWHAICEFVATEVSVLCSLDATCTYFRHILTDTFWNTLSTLKFGTTRGNKRAYISGMALTCLPPTKQQYDGALVGGDVSSRAACSAANKSIVAIGIYPRALRVRENDRTHYPLRIFSPRKWNESLFLWQNVSLDGPCLAVELVGDDDAPCIVCQTSRYDLWACRGSVKTKIILPHADRPIRAIKGSNRGLVVLQDEWLCWFVMSHGGIFVLQHHVSRVTGSDTIGLFKDKICHVSYSRAKLWQIGRDGSLEEMFQFDLDLPRNRTFSSGCVCMSDRYIVVTPRPFLTTDVIRVFDIMDGTLLRTIAMDDNSGEHPNSFNTLLHPHIVNPHFLVTATKYGVGLAIYNLCTGAWVRSIVHSCEHQVHSLVRLPSFSYLAFLATYNGGDQVVWKFEQCFELE